MGLYQDHTAGCGSPAGDRPTSDHLHRRYPRHGGDRVSPQRPCDGSGVPAGKPGVCDKSPQIRTGPFTGSRIPGVHCQLQTDGAEAPWGENKENQSRGRQSPAVRHSVSSDPFPANWEDECSHAGHSDGPPVLQEPPDLPPRGPAGGSELLLNNSVDKGGERRAGVVERSLHSVEWLEPDSSQLLPHHRDRCLEKRVGGRVQWSPHRGTVDPRGENHAHQLPGAPGSLSGSEMFCKGQNKPDHSPQDGQYVSTDVHQETRGNDFPTTEQPSQRTMAVVHGEEHPPQSPAPSRCIEHHCRWRIPSDERSDRLETVPSSLPANQSEAGPSGGGPVCQQVDLPTEGVCQLETRPVGNSHGCIHFGLGRAQSIRQPAVEPDRQGTGPDTPTTSGACPSGTSVEGTGMVPSAPRDAGGSSSPDPPEEGSDPSHTRGHPSSGGPPTSRVGYLRQRYQDCRVSEGATKLLLVSWRQKSSKTYDSLFGKWVSWCRGRDSDPVSCAIGEVINFLAHLYEQGYQYRSINSYRSAISSVHEKVDGYEVGQHPMVSRLLKGIFHERPPQPRYSETWDVSKMTSYIESRGENDALSLTDLTHKTVMLLALTRPSRSADLSHLDLRFRKYLPEGVSFQPTKLTKQSRQSKPVAEFFFPAFTANPLLCPVTTLRAYEGRTEEFRREEGSSPLFLTTIRPHNVASSSTIARWLRSILEKAGIDTSIFKAHSVRGAAVTAASNAGVKTCDILNAADWSSPSVFQRFYYKPSKQTGFDRAVLDPGSTGNTTNTH